MPLVKRKRRLFSCIADVVFAPMAFVGAGLITTWPFLLLASICAVFCLIVGGQAFELDWPPREFIIIAAGTFVFIALAAVPLAIRDHVQSGGFETVWIPDDECVIVGREFAEFLLSRNFHSAFGLMHPDAKSGMDVKQMSHCFLSCWEQSATPDAIANVSEVPISLDEIEYPEGDSEVIAVTEVTFRVSQFVPNSSSYSHLHHLTLGLRPVNDSFRIMSYRYSAGYGPSGTVSFSNWFHT